MVGNQDPTFSKRSEKLVFFWDTLIINHRRLKYVIRLYGDTFIRRYENLPEIVVGNVVAMGTSEMIGEYQIIFVGMVYCTYSVYIVNAKL